MSKNLYRLYLLEETVTGYVLVDNVEVQGSPTAFVSVIEDAARTAISQRLGLSSTADIELDVYQPPVPFGDHGMEPPELGKKLQMIFSDDYRTICLGLLSSDRLEDIQLKEHLIVVFTISSALEFRFFLFNRATNTYFGEGKVTAEVDQTVGDIEDAARGCIVKLGGSSVFVRIASVLEPTGSLLEEFKQGLRSPEEYDCKISIDPKRVILHGTNTSLKEISARDSLIIEFEFQYLVLFEKAGSSYKCFGSHQLLMSSNTDETVDGIVKEVRVDFPSLSQREFFGAYQLLGEYKDLAGKPPKKIETEVPLDDDYLRENTIYCPPQRPLQSLESNTLVIIFGTENWGYENRKSSSDSIVEEPFVTRKMIVEAVRRRNSLFEDTRPEELQSTQDLAHVDVVLNERPIHMSGPAIQIYHPVFAKFLSRAFLPFDGDGETLRQTWKLMEASRQCYKTEASRIEALRFHLTNLVHRDVLNEKVITVNDGMRFIPTATIHAGCYWGTAQPVCAFMEVVNEVETGDCDPALKCQSDFVKLCSANIYRPIADASCCPMFLLAVAGARLLVAGAVFADNYIAQELTDYLTLGAHPTDPDRGLRRTAQVLATLRECIQDLASFYSNLKFIPRKPTEKYIPSRGAKLPESRSQDYTLKYMPESPLGRWVFPYRTEFKVHENTFFLTYKGPPANEADSERALFSASMKSSSEEAGRPVVVKFTRKYCPEAHRLLAEMSLAPQLIYHEYATGIHFVVMEYLEASEVTSDVLKSAGGAKHVESLRRAVRALHDEGFVFGDLREPNILAGKDGVKLVDFDWSGKEGTVCYPVDISREIQWPKGVGGEEEIKAEHDKEWFKWLTGTEL